MRRVVWAVSVVVLAALSTAPGPAAGAAGSTGVSVVAAEEFWGSIARQLGGDHADVTSIIDDPETHAHDYEPRPSDGAAFATARIAIVNGIGYDRWATDLIDANRPAGQRVLTVGEVVGVDDGANPHQWYSPRSVDRMIDAITDALKAADPGHAAYFDDRRTTFRRDGLKRYNELRAAIRSAYDGTPVGATESIFAPLAEDLGLEIITPTAFQAALAEGEDPTAADKATVDEQIESKKIKVLVVNAQNSTPDVASLVKQAEKAGIPVTTVTETPSPRGASFQDWQTAQLQSLADSLARATGRPAGPSASPSSAPTEVSPLATADGPGDSSGSGGTNWLVPLGGGALAVVALAVTGGVARRRRSPAGA